MTKEQILTDLYVRLTGRKFLTFVVVSALLLCDNFGWLTLDAETKRQLITLAIGYLIVEGGVDGVKAYKAGSNQGDPI